MMLKTSRFLMQAFAIGALSLIAHSAELTTPPNEIIILTGGYPQRAGFYMGIKPIRRAYWFLGFDPAEVTLAERTRRHPEFKPGNKGTRR